MRLGSKNLQSPINTINHDDSFDISLCKVNWSSLSLFYIIISMYTFFSFLFFNIHQAFSTILIILTLIFIHYNIGCWELATMVSCLTSLIFSQLNNLLELKVFMQFVKCQDLFQCSQFFLELSSMLLHRCDCNNTACNLLDQFSPIISFLFTKNQKQNLDNVITCPLIFFF